MPKNNSDAKYSRANNHADSKDNRYDAAHFTEEAEPLKDSKAADYVPSLNNVTKNET
ncbi:hypothetical protein ['Paenibacillus yunnanensis' Narsing Rao et al. 2020]|uniref:hypothetical protein n=1 Tax=Paenibacillus tengchongensis TaxID=2608684 RepID=UPI001652595E|nr:hypothetical protein [Paenibacillus tengchongensis]